MRKGQSRIGILYLFGHATFITLLILAWQHAELRTTSGDSGFQVFKWIAYPGWNVEAHRYAAILPQAAVKFFKLWHVGLSGLLLVASVSHVLVAYAVFLFCAYAIKAPRSAMGAALAAVLCTRLTFYGPVLEANYLLCFPFLFFGVIEHHGAGPWRWRTIVGLVVAAMLSLLVHPLGWAILMFGALFLWSEAQLTSRQAAVLIGPLLFWWAASRWLFPPTAYEAAQYAKLGPGIADLGHITQWGSWAFLVGHTFHFTTNYLPALILFVAVVIGYGALHHARSAVLVAMGVIGLLMVNLVTFRAGDAAIMMDRAFLPVATLIALPCLYLLNGLKGRWVSIASVCLVVVLFIKLRDISFGSRGAQRQMDHKMTLLLEVERAGVSKAVVGDDVLKAHGITPDWAFPYSMLLLSAAQGPGHTVVLVQEDDDTRVGNGSTSDPVDTSTILMDVDTLYFQRPAGPFVRLGDVPDAKSMMR